jgi:hypothetical protein
MEKQRCAKCDREYQPAKSWQRFCTPKCRDAWHYEQWKHEGEGVKEAEAERNARKQLPELREKIDGMQIVQALKSGQPVEASAEPLRRRVLI